MANDDDIFKVISEHNIGEEGLLPSVSETQGDDAGLLKVNAEIKQQIEICRGWVGRFIKRSTINRNITATMLQVRIEAETGSKISLGALLVACVMEGVMIRRTAAGESDAFTNLSLKLASS